MYAMPHAAGACASLSSLHDSPRPSQASRRSRAAALRKVSVRHPPPRTTHGTGLAPTFSNSIHGVPEPPVTLTHAPHWHS